MVQNQDMLIHSKPWWSVLLEKETIAYEENHRLPPQRQVLNATLCSGDKHCIDR